MDYMNKNPHAMDVFITVQTNRYDPKTMYVDNNWEYGFSFNPTLRRKRDYDILPGGYMGAV